MSSKKKNKHVRVNGRLLNMGKGWKDLKVKQREFIAKSLVSNIEIFLSENEFKGIKSMKNKFIKQLGIILGREKYGYLNTNLSIILGKDSLNI